MVYTIAKHLICIEIRVLRLLPLCFLLAYFLVALRLRIALGRKVDVDQPTKNNAKETQDYNSDNETGAHVIRCTNLSGEKG